MKPRFVSVNQYQNWSSVYSADLCTPGRRQREERELRVRQVAAAIPGESQSGPQLPSKLATCLRCGSLPVPLPGFGRHITGKQVEIENKGFGW